MDLVKLYIRKEHTPKEKDKIKHCLIMRQYSILCNYTKETHQQEYLNLSLSVLREQKIRHALTYGYSEAIGKYLYYLWVDMSNYEKYVIAKDIIIKAIQSKKRGISL